MRTQEQLMELYRRLFDHFGPQNWWPADSPFEVVVGAVLTQNTNWTNVEKALENCKRAGVLSLDKLSALPAGLLAEYIRPAGYYNVKAARLLNLLTSINTGFAGDLEAFLGQETDELRRQLLAVKGIGPETADSILLYAAGRPVFVVDAYAHRILSRHDLIDGVWDYAQLQELFVDNLPPEVSLYNEYHALLVRVGKEFCKKSNPRCGDCPLQGI